MPFEGGPFLQAGCLVENVIEEKTGVLSLIRIIDTVTRTLASPDPPEDLPPFPYTIKLVLMFKSGMARGRSTIRVLPELPTGASLDPMTVTAHFEGEEKGQNVVMNLALMLTHEGLYWFHVDVDGERLTSIPLRVKYDRIVAGASKPAP